MMQSRNGIMTSHCVDMPYNRIARNLRCDERKDTGKYPAAFYMGISGGHFPCPETIVRAITAGQRAEASSASPSSAVNRCDHSAP